MAHTSGNHPSDLFPFRGEFERLSISFITLGVGATEPFSVLHISDSHLTDVYPDESERKREISRIRTRQFGGKQWEALEDSLAWAATHDDYVIHTGDIIDFQSRANFDHVKRLLGENVIGTVGNHEFSPEMWLSEVAETQDDAWRARSRPELANAFPFDLSFSTRVVNGVNFVMVDNAFGTVTQNQLDAFVSETRKGLPIVLGMHVPIYTAAIVRAMFHYWRKGGGKFRSAAIPEPEPFGNWLAQANDATTDAFIREVKGNPLVKAVLAGHLHFAMQDRLSSTAAEYLVGGNYLFHAQEILFV